MDCKKQTSARFFFDALESDFRRVVEDLQRDSEDFRDDAACSNDRIHLSKQVYDVSWGCEELSMTPRP